MLTLFTWRLLSLLVSLVVFRYIYIFKVTAVGFHFLTYFGVLATMSVYIFHPISLLCMTWSPQYDIDIIPATLRHNPNAERFYLLYDSLAIYKVLVMKQTLTLVPLCLLNLNPTQYSAGYYDILMFSLYEFYNPWHFLHQSLTSLLIYETFFVVVVSFLFDSL